MKSKTEKKKESVKPKIPCEKCDYFNSTYSWCIKVREEKLVCFLGIKGGKRD